MAAKRKRTRSSGARRPRARANALGAVAEPSWQSSGTSRDRLPLEGKVALLTGAARRIGACIARTLQAAGANVMIHYHRSEAEARTLASELNNLRGGSAALVGGNLLETKKLGVLVDATVKTFGQLDVLINNASTFYPTPVGEITEEHWNDLLGTNLKAPLFLTQAAAPALRLTHGLVLNIADIHGMRPLRRYTTYSVAKAGRPV